MYILENGDSNKQGEGVTPPPPPFKLLKEKDVMSKQKIVKNEKPIKVFYATCKNLSFSVTILTEQPCDNCKAMGFVVIDGQENKEECPVCKGKKTILKKVVKQATNGQQLYIGNEPQFVEEFYSFTNIRASNQFGYVSIFEVFKDTPQYVFDELENIAKDPTVDSAMYQDVYDKVENPARFEELEKNRMLRAKNEALQSKLDENKDKVASADSFAKKEVAKAMKEVDAKHSSALKEMQDKIKKYEKESK